MLSYFFYSKIWVCEKILIPLQHKNAECGKDSSYYH